MVWMRIKLHILKTNLDVVNTFVHSIHHEEGVVQILLSSPSEQTREQVWYINIINIKFQTDQIWIHV